jgi:hypothetical protein
MKMNLYNIEENFSNIVQQIIDNDGVISPELSHEFEMNAEQLQKKGISIGYVIKKINNDVDVVDSEIKRLTALKKSRKATVLRLKETLMAAMNNHSITELKTETLTINFRKSEVVEVENEKLLIPEFKIIKITADKAAIKKYLKDGGELLSCKLVDKQNIQIK